MRGQATARLLGLALSLATALPAPVQAGGLAGTCELTVQGRRYIRGPCEISLDGDGGFSVSQWVRGRLTWFAVVSKTDTDRADGYWNEDRGASHAHTPLGVLQRRGACWQNAAARVCAWR